MLTGAVILLLLFVFLLAIPVSLTYQVGWRSPVCNEVELRWAFGLVRVQISSQQFSSKSSAKSKPTKAGKKTNRSARGGKSFFNLVRQEPFRQRIICFIGDLWRSIKKESITVHIRVGLDDPADTGRLWAIVGPVSGVMANIRQLSVNIEPDFVDAGFELNSSGFVQFNPLRILLISLGLLFSPAVWLGIQRMQEAK